MKKVFALVLTVLMAVSVFAGCKPSEGSGSTVIKVGTSGPLTGDYAVMAMCVDSDYNMMELYRSGELLEKSCIGECYDEYAEEFGYGEPDLEKWVPLLLNSGRLEDLKEALFDVDVFADGNLRLLTELTGLPILDDEMMMSAV